jgi:hypothetical protein
MNWVFRFGSSSGVSSIQKRSLGHRPILYKSEIRYVFIAMYLLCETRIATHSRCVRSVGDNKAQETLPFSIEFVPEGEP